MANNETRFVVLHHRPGENSARTGEVHFDWMFASDQVLRTWSTPVFELLGATSDIEVDCERLADHRIEYLDFEGGVSGDRGTVVQSLAGTYRLVESNVDRFQAALRWTDESGTRSGRVEIYRSARPAVGLRSDESCGCWRLRFSPGRYETKR